MIDDTKSHATGRDHRDCDLALSNTRVSGLDIPAWETEEWLVR